MLSSNMITIPYSGNLVVLSITVFAVTAAVPVGLVMALWPHLLRHVTLMLHLAASITGRC